jgi:Amino acid transporters
MASLAQVAGQYGFLLFNAKGIGSEPDQRLGAAGRRAVDRRDDLYLLPGHRGLRQLPEGAAGHRAGDAGRAVDHGAGQGRHRDAPPGHLTPSLSWLNPFHISSFSAFTAGIILMVFIYWGWDTAVAVNEETKDKNKTPGRAAILSTSSCWSPTRW